VEPDALRFAFEILKHDTVAAGAELEIERLPIVFYCRDCENDYIAEMDDLRCPVCMKADNTIKQGREMIIKTITGEQDA
jgi:hydrogenase nickel incorporation protein HypA/HybF